MRSIKNNLKLRFHSLFSFKREKKIGKQELFLVVEPIPKIRLNTQVLKQKKFPRK